MIEQEVKEGAWAIDELFFFYDNKSNSGKQDANKQLDFDQKQLIIPKAAPVIHKLIISLLKGEFDINNIIEARIKITTKSGVVENDYWFETIKTGSLKLFGLKFNEEVKKLWPKREDDDVFKDYGFIEKFVNYLQNNVQDDVRPLLCVDKAFKGFLKKVKAISLKLDSETLTESFFD